MRLDRDMFDDAITQERLYLPSPVNCARTDGNTLDQRALGGIFCVDVDDHIFEGFIASRIRRFIRTVGIAGIPVGTKRRMPHRGNHCTGVLSCVAPESRFVFYGNAEAGLVRQFRSAAHIVHCALERCGGLAGLPLKSEDDDQTGVQTGGKIERCRKHIAEFVFD